MVDTEALRAFALKKRESSTLSRGTNRLGYLLRGVAQLARARGLGP